MPCVLCDLCVKSFFLAAFILKFRAEYQRIEMSFENEFSKLKFVSR